MTLRRGSRRSSARRTSRKRTTWENLFIEQAHGTAGEQKVTDLTPEPMGAAGIGTATIVRSIISFSYMLDAAATTATPQQLGIGITVVTNDAFAALAVPDPLSDFAQDWYYWTARAMRLQLDAMTQISWDVDIRSARRLRGGFKLAIISQSPASNDVDTTLFITMRNLWQITS